MKRPPLPIGVNRAKIFIDTRYAWFAEKYAAQVASMFTRGENQTDFDSYTWEGQKLRRELHDLQFCWADFEKIAKEYQCVITNAQVYRLYPTIKATDRGCGYEDVAYEMKNKTMWLSETWHTDNTHDADFRLFIYLNDVGPSQGPFGVWDPVEFVPHKLNACPTSKKPSGLRGPRFKESDGKLMPMGTVGREKKLTGPAGSTIAVKRVTEMQYVCNFCQTSTFIYLMLEKESECRE
jgi:hypothetical protein